MKEKGPDGPGSRGSHGDQRLRFHRWLHQYQHKRSCVAPTEEQTDMDRPRRRTNKSRRSVNCSDEVVGWWARPFQDGWLLLVETKQEY